jgi:hypothetical protein
MDAHRTPDGVIFYLTDRPRLEAMLTAANRAGIQAGWESWEPENAPGLVPMPVTTGNVVEMAPDGLPKSGQDVVIQHTETGTILPVTLGGLGRFVYLPGDICTEPLIDYIANGWEVLS